jgi:hypothetical protein
MPYPWPSFGAVLFRREERALEDTDTRWRRAPTYDISRPLGSSRDSAVQMAAGSSRRSWEAYFEPDRVASLEGLVGTTSELTDWDADNRQALLLTVTILQTVGSRDAQNAQHRKHRVRLDFLEQ